MFLAGRYYIDLVSVPKVRKGMNISNIPLKLCTHGQHGTRDFNMFKYSPFKKRMQKHKKIPY